MAESEEELKRLLMKVKEESDKAGLKYSKNEDHCIWSRHFMENRWETMETVTDSLFFWTPKSLWVVTAAMKFKDTCSVEEKLSPTWTAY